MANRQTTAKGGNAVPFKRGAGFMLVRLQLPKAIHLDFRVEAAKEGASMSNMARRLVEDWVAARKKGAK